MSVTVGGLGHLGRYKLLDVLGGGSFATVYRALDPQLGREVAIKLLLPHLAHDEEARLRFLAEGRALAALHHPNIVEVLDVGVAGETIARPYLVMELIAGRPLSEAIPPEGLPLARTVTIVSALGSALDALHQAGLVHRDVKAENVMLAEDGRIVLIDFGIVRTLAGGHLTEAGFGMGTPETAAPEQIDGRAVGPPADVYALGVLAYRLLAARPPFRGDVSSVLDGHLHRPPPALRVFRPELPEAVCLAVHAALEKDPERRPPSGGAFAHLLETAAARESGAVPDTKSESTSERAEARAEGHGNGTGHLHVEAGVRRLRLTHASTRGPFRVAIYGERGEQPDVLAVAPGPYDGVVSRRFPYSGTYTLTVQAGGPWSASVLPELG